MRSAISILIILILLVGCSAIETNSKHGVTVTSLELFHGKEERFKPFLGNMSGAFQLKYSGEIPNVTLELEIWEKGQKTGTLGAIHDLFFSEEDKQRKELEVMISNELINIKDHVPILLTKISFITESGNNYMTLTNEWDEKWNVRSLIHTYEKQMITLGESAPVFGIQTTSSNKLYTSEFSAESLNRIEYALIFTLHVEE